MLAGMKNAPNEFIDKQGGGDFIEYKVADVTVSSDGSLQKGGGYSSLNGVATVIASDSGKCVDFCVFTKTCNACPSLEKRKINEPEL